MESPKTPTSSHPLSSNPFQSLSTFIHHLTTDLTTQFNNGRKLASNLISSTLSPLPLRTHTTPHPFSHSSAFASIAQAKTQFDASLSSNFVAKTLVGTSVYTVSNTNNEFVLISDPNNGAKSIGLLCFRKEDAEAYLAQVQTRRKELRSQAKIVPISLDQVSSVRKIKLYF
ncbi:Protein TIC 22 chloroplastic [Bienertia sinuspersici]